MSIERIHKLVFEAIETARENGFNFTTPREWATDLLRHHAELESEDFDEVLECVEIVLQDPTLKQQRTE